MAVIPLDKRTIPVTNKNGLLKDAPAIHKMWSQPRIWTNYQFPPSANESKITGAVDSWLATSKKTLSELCWLLKLPANKFWSQICNDDGLHMWLGEILETFPREHERDNNWSDVVHQMNKNILQKMFLVHVRLCTHKESSSDFFTPEAWGHMLYDKYLLELPKILDMCVLFAPCNKAITNKMIANVFKYQNQYMGDLLETGLTLEAALDSASEQYQVLSLSQPSQTTYQNFLDLVRYSLDISITLNSIVSVYPPVCHPLHQTGLEIKLAMFYTNVITPLINLSHKYLSSGVIDEIEHSMILKHLGLSRHNVITTVREILCQVCLATSLHLDSNKNQNLSMVMIVEDFLTVFTSFLSEKSFLIDYNNTYPISAEFDLFLEFKAEIDQTRKHYILDALTSTTSSRFTSSIATSSSNKSIIKEEISTITSLNGTDNSHVNGASCSVNLPKSEEIDSMISTVRDLLPYLGEGFVERVLVEYQFKIDDTINALLENNLPSHLKELDQSLPKETKPKELETVSLVQRSVYDDDEFDVLNRDIVDTSRVFRGKKDKCKDAKKLLDDKSDLCNLKDRFDKLAIVVDEFDQEGYQDNGEYDDEYDDTYDDGAFGEQEPDAIEELGRPFVLPVALGGGKIRAQIIDVDDDDESEEEDSKDKQNFVRNPEEVRQEQERKRAEKMNRANRKGGNPGVPSNRDVVGRAKGQGQEKHVLLARARKNANKGKGQRIGADKKAAKGMF